MQIKKAPTTYDVCIVGSGAGGGMAAYVLTEAGARVVMLEAGPTWDSAKDSEMLAWPYESPRRGAANKRAAVRRVRRLHRRRGRSTASLTRSRRRTRIRLVPRADARRPHEPLGPHLAALRARTTSAAHELDGLGDDWPISYEDIKPYYDKLDRLVGIFGTDRTREPARTSRTASSCRRPSRAATSGSSSRRAIGWASHASRRGCRS